MNSLLKISKRFSRSNTLKKSFSTSSTNQTTTTSFSTTPISWLLENHGGKVGLVAVTFAGGLIWSYFEGGNQKSKLEDLIEKNFLLEPYETLLLRYTNNNTFSLSKFHDIIKNEFMHDIKDQKFLTLSEFAQRLEENCKLRLVNNYLFERAIATYIERCEKIQDEIDNSLATSSNSSDSSILSSLTSFFSSSDSSDSSTPKYPSGLKLMNNFQYVRDYNKETRNLANLTFDVVFLLSLLSHFTQLISVSDDKEKTQVIQRSNAFISMVKFREGIEENEELTKGMHYLLFFHIFPILFTHFSFFFLIEQVASLIDYLETTSQIPAEFQPNETGQSWPYRTYRQKTSEEIVRFFFYYSLLSYSYFIFSNFSFL